MLVILTRFEAEQRQPKTVLPAGFAVATAAIATRLCKDGDDLIWKIDRRGGVKLFDRDGKCAGNITGNPRRYRRSPIAQRGHETIRIHIHKGGLQWRRLPRQI